MVQAIPTSGVLLFIILPVVAAVVIIAVSIHSAVRRFSVVQVVLAIPTISLVLIALLAFHAMFNGAFATYLPHLAIAGSVPLVLTQRYLARRA